ncbi:MAG: CBS domain-containing protein [Planctomycetota bacterium]|jgi:CBS domain-containing protein
MLQAKTIMKKDVLTVHPHETLDKVIRMLIQHNITGLPVVNEDATVAGVITEKDILNFLLEKDVLELMNDEILCNYTISRVMTSNVVTFAEDAPLDEVCQCLVTRNFRRVPIIDKAGKLTGIISRKDIMAVIS